MNKRLYRSEKNRLVAGVCGGLGQYFAVDPVLIRLAFALLMVFKFWLGLIAYILAAILIPEKGSNPDDAIEPEVVDHPYSEEDSGSQRKLAVALICVGGGLLLFRFFPRIPALSGYVNILKVSFWPLALIALGIWLIFRQNNH
ncbi:MAG: PspC domain-containing protein [Eubacteriales bacterium]|nr:PspC domain-containing protein [Eubacteriales bacterium]MDD3074063.1 PspC domain-containing protein [Eubacteriales bacterium]MDD4078779.1 PspC domain-containing protein [Eubacteriales bacterium]MDD4769019.1 PspC domain-containing protein [Eubacteriales bacterium]